MNLHFMPVVFIVLIGWLYVALMMALAEATNTTPQDREPRRLKCRALRARGETRRSQATATPRSEHRATIGSHRQLPSLSA